MRVSSRFVCSLCAVSPGPWLISTRGRGRAGAAVTVREIGKSRCQQMLAVVDVAVVPTKVSSGPIVVDAEVVAGAGAAQSSHVGEQYNPIISTSEQQTRMAVGVAASLCDARHQLDT